MSLPFPALRHFSIIEFQHPELLDNDFLHWLDEARHYAGVPFVLYSDARTDAENTRVGGSPTSLHRLGRAVDFGLRTYDPAIMFKVVNAFCETPTPENCGREIEYVIADKHWHVGLFPDQRPSRLILKASD